MDDTLSVLFARGGTLSDGLHTATVTMQDLAGNFSSASSPATTFRIDTSAPLALANGPYSLPEGASISLSASGSQDISGLADYQWDFDYDNAVFQIDATGMTPTFAAAQMDGPAARTVALRVCDLAGNFSVIVPASVNVTNAMPTATFSAAPAAVLGSPSTVSFANPFDPSSADTAAGFRYSYDFNNDGDFTDPGDVLNSTIATASHTFASAATFSVRGRISDKDGGYTDYTTSVTVNPPGLPAWLGLGSDATWNASTRTLTLDGQATLTADPAFFGDDPIVDLDSDDELLIDTGAGGARTISLQELNLSGNARLEFTAASSLYVLTVGVLSINDTAFLDLDHNALIVTSSTVTAVEAQVASGFNFFAWDGPGIRSTASLNDPNNFTTLGVLDGTTYAAINGNYFGDQTVADTDVLVKYTYYGDADLSGVVDGTDYALIDTGFANQLSGWFNGDFDRSGSVNGTDYALIDTVYVNQGGPMGYSFGLTFGWSTRIIEYFKEDDLVDALQIR